MHRHRMRTRSAFRTLTAAAVALSAAGGVFGMSTAGSGCSSDPARLDGAPVVSGDDGDVPLPDGASSSSSSSSSSSGESDGSADAPVDAPKETGSDAPPG